MALTAGMKLGPYLIQSLLGAGGMGEVYRARDTRLGREVAIKVLPPACVADTERMRRFEQEARAAAALSHPNVLAVFDVGQQDGHPYIVSELLEGETLRARLRSGAIATRKAVEYAVQIARGLAAAHAQGILHRDLKPENIFITRDLQIKILDFGLAKLTQPASSAVGGLSATVDLATGRGELLGTISYMSPEQLRGTNVDVRSDLFSFGAVLYEMVSGRRAFRGNTTADTITAILREDPPDLATTRDVPPMLERIVSHCLEKDPAARFQSARDVAFDLESLSTISTTSSSLDLPRDRRHWLIPALLSLIAVLLGVVGWLSLRLTPADAPYPQYRPLTFAREAVSSARYTPAHHTVIYSSARADVENALFSVTPESAAPVSLGLKDTDVESISVSGEMLLVQQRRILKDYAWVGVLARAPLTGGAPRPIVSDVQDADWGPDNQIALARAVKGRYHLEYPIGHVLYETDGYISNVRVSPKGVAPRSWIRVIFTKYDSTQVALSNRLVISFGFRKSVAARHDPADLFAGYSLG